MAPEGMDMSTVKKSTSGKRTVTKRRQGPSTGKKAPVIETAGKSRAASQKVKQPSAEQRRQAALQEQALKNGLHLLMEGTGDDVKWTWFCKETGRQILTTHQKTLRYSSPLDS